MQNNRTGEAFFGLCKIAAITIHQLIEENDRLKGELGESTKIQKLASAVMELKGVPEGDATKLAESLMQKYGGDVEGALSFLVEEPTDRIGKLSSKGASGNTFFDLICREGNISFSGEREGL
jgi:hypothetical protein